MSNKTSPLTGNLTLFSKKQIDLSDCNREEILEYFENSYDLNDSLFTALKSDDVFYKCPDCLRLPLIFYYAHTACVYINKMLLARLITVRVNFEFESLFETGVDEMSWDDTENYRMGGAFKWPSVPDVVDYRRRVRAVIIKVIQDEPLNMPIDQESPWWAIMMGIEHERIHIETSSVLIRQLPVELVEKPLGWKYAPATHGKGSGENNMVAMDQSVVKVGKPYDFPTFGFDDQYGKLEYRVPSFEATKYPITNKEFVQFVKAGGYFDKHYWTDEGWKWVMYRQTKHPLFWICESGCKAGCGGDLAGHTHCNHCKPTTNLTNGQNAHCNGHSTTDDNGHQGAAEGGGHLTYRYRTMFDVVDMPWDWPVEVNYHEAKAFSLWKGINYRLPTEAEYHVMRGRQLPPSEGTMSDISCQDKIRYNTNFQYGSSTPVNTYPPSSAGFYDTFGNVWEWCEDHFNGLAGYKPDRFYEDYSSPCFDGRHNLILGGSWISTGGQASRFTRNAFRRHFFQHAGFRLVKQSPMVEIPVRLVNTEVFVLDLGVQENPVCFTRGQIGFKVPSTNRHFYLETKTELNDMMCLEYNTPDSFPVQLAHLVMQLYRGQQSNARILHIGCGTGRGTFELANQFKDVVGADYCARFIDAAIRLQKGETVVYSSGNEKKIIKEVQLPTENVADRITFKQLTWLPNEIGFFDVVLFSNIDRVMEPKAWLARLWDVLNPDGRVFIASLGKLKEAFTVPGLSLVESHDLNLKLGGKNKTATVMVWEHANDD